MNRPGRQAVVLYVSTLLGILLGVLSSVINTRSLPPEAFGDFRYVQNIISFISSLLVFGYFVSGSRLLAISNSEENSGKIRGVMCVILAICVCSVMIFMAIASFYSLCNDDSNRALLYLCSIPFSGNVMMLSYINTTAQGDNHIVRIAIARFLPSALYCIIAIAIYSIYGASAAKMLLLYNGVSFIVLLFIIISTKPIFKGLRQSFYVLRNENKNYGAKIYVGSIFGVSTSYISGITLGQFCDTNTEVGFYTLALTVSSPLMTLPGIVGTTYFRRFAHQKKIDASLLLKSVGLTFLSLIIFIISIRYVVDILYSEEYSIVSEYASYLAVGMCLHGLGDMLNRFLGSHALGKEIRNSAILCGVITIIGSILLVYMFDINGAILTKIMSSGAYFMMLLYYYLKFIKKEN